jgi:tetratricopeptide (TPR) repeat protein/mono/diheme cytochrome c family protein
MGVTAPVLTSRLLGLTGLLALAAITSISLTASPPPPITASDMPTFNHDVAPIVFRNCVTCHHPGANGAFSLLTYEDVRPRARQITAATASRYMPPWKPEPGYGDELLGSRELRDDEIATIQRWVASGALQGDPADLPRPPEWTDGWRLGVPDLVIGMPDPFEVPSTGPDVFRIFVFPIPTNVMRYVKAIEFMPGTRAVHHANMRLDETRRSRELDEKDPAPGYDGLLAPTAHYPEGYFFGWTPGQLPPASADVAWRLNPGTDMVLQLHLRPTGKPERVQASIGLYFASGPPRLTPAMLRLGKQYIDIAPGQTDYTITDSYTLPVDVDVHGVQPHAHYRAKEINGFATLPDGTTKWLIYIRNWDFDWQDQYRYVKPLPLPKGTTLTMRYVYDNSAANKRNPQLPPARVHWGQNSTDEMGDLWIQVVPRSAADQEILTREFRQKVFREDILGYESVLRVTPDDVGLHDDVALLYMAVGRIPEAIAHFSESARLAPDSAATHFNLGTAQAAAGRIDEAIAQYRRALDLRPDYPAAHTNLGSVLLTRGALTEAAAHLSRSLELDPENAEAQNNFGKLLTYKGQTDEAIPHLRRALEIREDYAEAHYNMAHALVAQGDALGSVAHYLTALKLRPEWPPVLSECAWLLATHPSERVRDPQQAIAFAERAVALTSRRDPVALDILAAAYASDGRFDQASITAQAAIDLLSDRDRTAAAAEIRQRLVLYQQRSAYVDVRGAGPAHVP